MHRSRLVRHHEAVRARPARGDPQKGPRRRKSLVACSGRGALEIYVMERGYSTGVWRSSALALAAAAITGCMSSESTRPLGNMAGAGPAGTAGNAGAGTAGASGGAGPAGGGGAIETAGGGAADGGAVGTAGGGTAGGGDAVGAA